MIFRRIKSDGLSHVSYFLASGSEAVIIDPRRDVDVYLDLARDYEVRIRWILETHRNEDYVIGSTALAAFTGAEIAHGSKLDFDYGTAVSTGDSFEIGTLRIRVHETPGHTPESLTYALADTESSDDPLMAFTGDALFVGDTGRVDLLGDERKREMAEKLHDSLFQTILPLGDGVILCPGHGAGSVCGGAIADRDPSTLGYERRHNPALQAASQANGRDQFIRRKLDEKHVKPPYFKRMEEWNQKGNAPIHERVPVIAPLSPHDLAERMKSGAEIVDMRMPQAFAGGHIPGSYNIWMSGISSYLGWIVPVDRPLLLVLPEHADIEQVTRTLLRIGYDRIDGYLRGGFESWQNQGREIERHATIDTRELRARIESGDDLLVLDVRKPGEWDSGTVPGARTIFVGHLQDELDQVPQDRPVVTMCSVGHRGGIAASVLLANGYRRVSNYLGGFTAWERTAS